MLVSAMRPRRASSFEYARTTRSGEPFALDRHMTAYRRWENWINAVMTSLVSPRDVLAQVHPLWLQTQFQTPQRNSNSREYVLAKVCGVRKTFPVFPVKQEIFRQRRSRPNRSRCDCSCDPRRAYFRLFVQLTLERHDFDKGRWRHDRKAETPGYGRHSRQ